MNVRNKMLQLTCTNSENIYEEKYLGAFSICKILDFPNAKIAESPISRLK